MMSDRYQQQFSSNILSEHQSVKVVIHTYQQPIDNFIKRFVEKCRKVESIKKTLTKKLVPHEVAGGGHDPSTSGL